MKLTLWLVVAAIILLAGMFLPSCRVIRQFDHLERSARKTITASELQTWAINLLAKYPSNTTTSVWPSELGTNFPNKLLKLYHVPPNIFIFGPTADWPVPHLSITWGGGFIGHTGFEVGPTNFPGWRGTNTWAPGVYFFKQP
jgi:hypothetical protein